MAGLHCFSIWRKMGVFLSYGWGQFKIPAPIPWLQLRYRSSSQKTKQRSDKSLHPFATSLLNVVYNFCYPLMRWRKLNIKMSILFVFFFFFVSSFPTCITQKLCDVCKYHRLDFECIVKWLQIVWYKSDYNCNDCKLPSEQATPQPC